MTVDELQVLITANTKQLQSEIAKTQQSIANLSSSASKSTSKLTSSFIKASIFTKTLGLAIKTVTSNLGGAISRLDTLNNYTKVMGNLGVSGDDAEASIQRLSDKLTGLPTTLDDAVSSVQRFTSANGNVKASTDMFLALNNAILSGGANTQIQASALEQLSQAYAKGKPDMMEWRTAMMAMPAQLKQVAIAMGYASANNLGEALRDGTVSMNEFMGTIMKLNKEGIDGFSSFEEQAKGSTGGVATSITNVKTAITRGLTEILNAIGQSNIAGFFQAIASAINKVIPYITGFVKACVWAVSSISKLFGGGKTKKEIDNTTSSMKGLGNSGTSTSKGLDKTTGSAKKLNKELNKLANFDEMNVLTENKDNDSGGSGDAGDIKELGALDFSDWDTNLSGASSKADEIAEKIKSAFLGVAEYVNNLDFTGIMGHLSGIKTKIIDIFTDPRVVNAGSNWGNTLMSTLKNVTGNISIIGLNIAEGLVGSVNTYLGGNSERVKNFIVGMFDISSRNLGITDKLSSTLAEISNIFTGETATSIGANIIGMFANPLMSLSVTFGNFATDMYDTLVTPITDNTTLIKEAFENTLEPINTVMGTLNEAFTTFGDNVSKVYDEHVKPFMDSLKAGLSDTFSKFLDVYNEYVAPFITNCADRFEEIWNDYLKPLSENISEFVGHIVDGIKLLWENWLKPVIDWIIQNIVPIIVPILDQIGNVVSTVIKIIINTINNVLGVLNGVITFIKGVFTGNWTTAWNGIKKIFNTIWNGMKNTVTTVVTFIKDFISNAFNIIKRTITTIMNTVKSTISNVWNGIWSAVKNVINCIIGGLNSLIRGINKISFDVPNWVPVIGGKKWGFNIPNIPKLAQGGIVDKPTVAMIGEAGKEAVMPLENNTGWIDELAEKLSGKFGGNGNPIQLIVKIGEDTILNKFIDGIKQKNFETNGEVFSI